MKLFSKGLSKWPALIVVGKPVTKEQAKEIIIRTDSLNFSTNDAEFSKQLNKIVYDIPSSRWDLNDSICKIHNLEIMEAFSWQEKKLKSFNLLNLDYLRNHQIVSSWIGGAHGWCNWNGYIGCNNYNIGKYPSVEEVYNEWVIIAKEFPFLNLKSQLLSGETCEENLAPVVEYIIKNGKVKLIEPKEVLNYPNNNLESLFRILYPGGERGCTIEQFQEALDYVIYKNKRQ